MPPLQLRRPQRLIRPKTAPAFELTERDRTIVRFVSDYRFATSDQIYRYLCIADPGTSHQKVLRRLKVLFAARYLCRPYTQHFELGPLAHLVYSLDIEGLRLLAEADAPIDQRALWSTKASRTASAPFLRHALAVTETMLAFARDCAERTGVVLLDQPQVIALMPEETRTQTHPLRLRVMVKENMKSTPISLTPDRLFSLAYPNSTRHNACVEVDRGSMPIASRRLTKSSFGKKIRGYLAAYEQQRHQTQWGFRGFRILTVTPSEARIRAMLDAQREITRGRLGAMFLYSTPQRIAELGPFGNIWISTESDSIALMDGA